MKRIKDELAPVNMRHKTIVRITLVPVRYANESMDGILMQGTMFMRDDISSRMDEAIMRKSRGQLMAHGIIARYGDEPLDDEQDQILRQNYERDLLGAGASDGHLDENSDDDGADDGADEDMGSDMSDDSLGDMEDLDAMGNEEDEEKLKRKTVKIVSKHFRFYAPLSEFPMIAPSIRYTYNFVDSAKQTFPPRLVDMELKKIDRKKKEYKWKSFSTAVSQFAPFIMHDLHAKQQATGRVGSCRDIIKSEVGIVRITSRTFRDTAMRIFHNAFRPESFYKMYPHLPPNLRDTITDSQLETIWNDIAEDGDIEPYLYPTERTPIDAISIYNDLRTFTTLSRRVSNALRPVRKNKRKRRRLTNANAARYGGESESSDDDSERMVPVNPLGENILQANRIWRHFMEKSLDNTYAWSIDDVPGPVDQNTDGLMTLVNDKVAIRVDDGIYTSYQCGEMINEIKAFCTQFKEHILIEIGRGVDADDMIINSYVYANQPYPIERKKRYIMCPTRSHTELASERCGYIPVNLADLDKVREDVRLKALPNAELVVIDGAHLFGLRTIHFLICKIKETLRTRPRPFRLVFAGAPILVACKSHTTKWPIFKDMAIRLELMTVPDLATPTGHDLTETLGKNPAFKFTSNNAKLKAFTYDDSKSPAWAGLHKREQWKWFATATRETAARASALIIKLRDQIRELGHEPLILFDYASTLKHVTATANLACRQFKNGDNVVERDGGQAVVSQFYEIKSDRTLSPLRNDLINTVHPKFVAYHIKGMPRDYRASLLSQPIEPLKPTTLMQCRYTPADYVIFVSGTHILRKDDITTAMYYATKRLFILIPESTKNDITVSDYVSKRNIFDFFNGFQPY